jgi:hypothetical protein
MGFPRGGTLERIGYKEAMAMPSWTELVALDVEVRASIVGRR